MKGTIIDTSLIDAFISLENGETVDISLSKLPKNSKVGDSVNIPFNNAPTLSNNKPMDFF